MARRVKHVALATALLLLLFATRVGRGALSAPGPTFECFSRRDLRKLRLEGFHQAASVTCKVLDWIELFLHPPVELNSQTSSPMP